MADQNDPIADTLQKSGIPLFISDKFDDNGNVSQTTYGAPGALSGVASEVNKATGVQELEGVPVRTVNTSEPAQNQAAQDQAQSAAAVTKPINAAQTASADIATQQDNGTVHREYNANGNPIVAPIQGLSSAARRIAEAAPADGISGAARLAAGAGPISDAQRQRQRGRTDFGPTGSRAGIVADASRGAQNIQPAGGVASPNQQSTQQAQQTPIYNKRGQVVESVAASRPMVRQTATNAEPTQTTSADRNAPAGTMQPVRETVKTATGTTTYAAPKEYDRNSKPETAWSSNDFAGARNDITAKLSSATTPQQVSSLQAERARLGAQMMLTHGDEEAKKNPQEALNYYADSTSRLQASLKANDDAFATLQSGTLNPEQQQSARSKLLSKEEQQYVRFTISKMQTRRGKMAAEVLKTTPLNMLFESKDVTAAKEGEKNITALKSLGNKENATLYAAMHNSPEDFAAFKGEIAARAAQEMDVKRHTDFSEGWKAIAGAGDKNLSQPEVLDQALDYLKVQGGEQAAQKQQRYLNSLDLVGPVKPGTIPEPAPTLAEQAIAAKHNQVTQYKAALDEHDARNKAIVSTIVPAFHDLQPLFNAFGAEKSSYGREKVLQKYAPASAKDIKNDWNLLDKELRDQVGKNAEEEALSKNLDPKKHADKAKLLANQAVLAGRQARIDAINKQKQLLEVQSAILGKLGVVPEESKKSDESNNTGS